MICVVPGRKVAGLRVAEISDLRTSFFPTRFVKKVGLKAQL